MGSPRSQEFEDNLGHRRLCLKNRKVKQVNINRLLCPYSNLKRNTLLSAEVKYNEFNFRNNLLLAVLQRNVHKATWEEIYTSQQTGSKNAMETS